MRTKVAVVGYGYWGPNLVRNLRTLPECDLRAVCDRDVKRLAHLHTVYRDIEGITDFSQILQDGYVDAVVIATPLADHYHLAKASLLAGKHTLVEKPMASTSAECEELIEIAERMGVVLMVGHTYLYSAPLRMLSKMVAEGDLGEIRYINSRRLNLGIFQKNFNVLWDLAPHDLSIILHLLGQMPVTVNCQGIAQMTPNVEDVTNLSLTFADNRFATIQSSWIEPRKVREMTIIGTKKMVLFNDIKPLEKLWVYDLRLEIPRHTDTLTEFLSSTHYGDCYVPRLEQDEPLKLECRHFIDCIQNQRAPISGGREGVEIVRILEAASKSLERNGGPVSIADRGEEKRPDCWADVQGLVGKEISAQP